MQNFKQTFLIRLMKVMAVLLIVIGGSLHAFSQSVSVNTTGLPPNSEAGLDVDFTNMGFLIPRVALTSTSVSAPMLSHEAGMMVYNTTVSGSLIPAFYINDGTKWNLLETNGYSAGDMQFWNGTTWDLIPAGKPGQLLQLGTTSIPLWVGAGYASLITAPAENLTSTSVTTGGNITTDGGVAVTARGVCWSTSPNPDASLSTKTIDGSGTGAFVSNISGLVTGTTYYLRAYATNATGIVYGAQVLVRTP